MGLIQQLELCSKPSLYKTHKHRRITVSGRPRCEGKSIPLFSLIGGYWSEYRSGPSLLWLADVAGWILGPGAYGLESCEYVGSQWEIDAHNEAAMEFAGAFNRPRGIIIPDPND